MRILFAAGGTAGHVNPALAIAEGLQERFSSAEIHFAGRQGGMERGLVEKAGYPFHHIEVRGVQRSFTPKNIARNAVAAWHLAFAPAAAKRILKEVNPQLVVGTGGYVSGPILQQAARMGIKTAIHEQNAYPGVTNRLLARWVNLVFAPTQSAVDRLGHPGKTVVSGNPVRPQIKQANREAARLSIGAGERTVLLSYGGSLGAMRLNEAAAQLAAWHVEHKNFLHIHATGSIEKEDFAHTAERLGLSGRENFIIKEYIDDMPKMLAAADLVICRAGALTLAELAAVGRASVLLPSPNVAENHQYHNAMEFVHAGAAELLQESELSEQSLIEIVSRITENKETLQQMGDAAKTLDKPNALQDIVSALAGLMG